MSDNNDIPTSKVASFFSVNGWWYFAAAFMLAVFVGFLIIVIGPDNKDTSSTTPTDNNPVPTAPLSSPATTGNAGATGWDDLGCNGTKGDTATPTLPLKVDWAPVGPLSAPTSADLGPTKDEGYLRTCYQHTPAGAAVAAANVLLVGRTVPTAQRADVLGELFTPGPGRDATIAADTPQDPGMRLEAFNVDSCSAERCNIALVAAAGTARAVANLSMVWVDGDWRVDGAQEPTGSAVTAVPAGYVSWKAGA